MKKDLQKLKKKFIVSVSKMKKMKLAQRIQHLLNKGVKIIVDRKGNLDHVYIPVGTHGREFIEKEALSVFFELTKEPQPQAGRKQ